MVNQQQIYAQQEQIEAITFRSSDVRSPTVGSVISVCGATIPLKMVVRDIDVDFDSQLDVSAQVSKYAQA